ncbi:uncharacterized protein N7458_002576 [Penicillium daleae]|uniref:Uncharacterized protein n=1 Tax=Penicillium daleae TaxID=63821 RepID=A0AAD6CD86_9EURO|nr:uncharacterized protein N7458_002576 [Penicillium daleae]KAJ5461024.1 hypothetical protein N7458_002576 [Penicillium daleae]
MQRALFTENELKQANERRRKYQGSARVKISDIQFKGSTCGSLDLKNVERLCGIFRKTRCQRFELSNYIPVTVSRQALMEAIHDAGVSTHSLLQCAGKDLPLLKFPEGQLTGLHGRHRLCAGSKILAPAERWWTVDIYLNDISEDLETSLIEEYANEKQPTDGEIYRKVRQYESDGNRVLRQKWLMRLSSDWKRQRMEQLNKESNERLRGGFDKLLVIPGLWPNGMRVSMFHRVIALTSIEEILTYLDHIYETYSSFVGGNLHALRRIETETVLEMQLKAPGNCEKDAKEIMGLIFSGQIFPSFDESERKVIWERIKLFDGIIPSLETFWKDFIFFEQCAQCMKRLFGVADGSIWNTMKGKFSGDSADEESFIQISDFTFRQQATSCADRLDLGYRQLWLYTMRHYGSIPAPAKCDEELLVKRDRGEIDEHALFGLADLARRVGFRTKEIESLLQKSPDRLIARTALLKARKPDHFRYDPIQLETLVDRVSACFLLAVEHNRPTSEVLADSEVSTKRRCGFPQKKAHSQDAPYLFLDQVHDEAAFSPVTTFFVRRCFYYAFLGKRPLPGTGTGQTGPSPPARDMSPLFVHENGSPVHAPETIDNVLERASVQARPVYENYQARRVLEGYRSPYIEDESSAQNAPSLEPDEVINSPEDDSMANGSSVAPEVQSEDDSVGLMEDEGIDDASKSPLFDRQEFRSSESDFSEKTQDDANIADDPSTPEETASDSEGPAHETQTSARNYSPSVYSVRRSSSIRESEKRRRLSEDLERSLKERERLDEDWERERLEQEFGLPNSRENFGENNGEKEQMPSSDPYIDNTRASSENENSPPREDPQIIEPELQNSSPTPAREDPISDEPHAPAKPSKPSDGSDKRAFVDFKFWCFENEEWRLADRHQVDPADPSLIERIARKYMRKKFRLYDQSLNSLSPKMCFRAGVADGTESVIMLSRASEEKLVKDGRFKTNDGVVKKVPKSKPRTKKAKPSYKQARLKV